jgi:hypothetical protein
MDPRGVTDVLEQYEENTELLLVDVRGRSTRKICFLDLDLQPGSKTLTVGLLSLWIVTREQKGNR